MFVQSIEKAEAETKEALLVLSSLLLSVSTTAILWENQSFSLFMQHFKAEIIA